MLGSLSFGNIAATMYPHAQVNGHTNEHVGCISLTQGIISNNTKTQIENLNLGKR